MYIAIVSVVFHLLTKSIRFISNIDNHIHFFLVIMKLLIDVRCRYESYILKRCLLYGTFYLNLSILYISDIHTHIFFLVLVDILLDVNLWHILPIPDHKMYLISFYWPTVRGTSYLQGCNILILIKYISVQLPAASHSTQSFHCHSVSFRAFRHNDAKWSADPGKQLGSSISQQHNVCVFWWVFSIYESTIWYTVFWRVLNKLYGSY